MSADKAERLAQFKAERDSLPLFGERNLQIRTKAGLFEPFKLNEAQRFVHSKLEEQREDKGWVRALVLKGRQQGISTYVAGRFYHKASMNRGVGVYILSHEQDSSGKLFAIVDRYQRNNPRAPHVGASNAKELVFDKLESNYVVATAGTKEGGRGGTVSHFHGSEVAFWANAPAHFAASVQGVPMLPGTEIILESTSAGAGGEFYERWLDAEAERGDFIPIFLPWWLTDEYTREPEPGFVLSSEADEGEMSEQEYADIYKVSLPKMAWRRYKIIELRDPLLFRREYPATPAEAWTSAPGHEPFIDPLTVVRARKRSQDAYGPLVLGVDPASNGGDRFSIAARRGFKCQWIRHRNKIDYLEGIAWIRSLIDELNPARVNIDAGNIGVDIITGLRSLGPKYQKIVRSVNFGATSEAKLAKPNVPGPRNRRAEMWGRMSDWLRSPEGASIPDDNAIQTDLTAPRLKPQLNNDFLLESKQDMKKRKVKSPDLADALALTFATNEYFTAYQAKDPEKAQIGVPETQGLRPAVSPGYSPPPIFGPTGWMG